MLPRGKIRLNVLARKRAGKRSNPFVPLATAWTERGASADPTSPHAPKCSDCPTKGQCASCRRESRRREGRGLGRGGFAHGGRGGAGCGLCGAGGGLEVCGALDGT